MDHPQTERKIVTVFGSSRPAPGEAEYLLAYELGSELGRAGFAVCNGGYGGIMAASARGAKEAGGTTIGVTTSAFSRIANQWIDREIALPTMIARLLKLVETGDAYAILKGGTGTLLELACVWEFINKGVLGEKPIIVVGDFWQSVVTTLREELLWEGAGDCTKFIRMVQTPRECAVLLKSLLS
jgi:uncharacterized protein (TIGR00730 family)